MNNFNDFKLPNELNKALQAIQFSTPTPIQADAIPKIIDGLDLIACAQTGTGKTAAFAIPMVKLLLESPDENALILAPTRELAAQIQNALKDLLKFCPRKLQPTLVIGGEGLQRQRHQLRKGPRIIVATPGRLNDFIRRKEIQLSNITFLVVDEGDRMMDMGFAPQIKEIMKQVPKDRQMLFFSATFPKDVKKLAMTYLNAPQFVSSGPLSQPVKKVKQTMIETEVGQKNDLLLDELNAREGSVMIFARTKRRTDKLMKYLDSYGHSVTRMHGDCRQGQRNIALRGFRSGKFRILVATDVAARGLDIPQIAHVINYDLPESKEDYVHRIGRTARAGAEGEALSLVTEEDLIKWKRINGERVKRPTRQRPQRSKQNGSKKRNSFRSKAAKSPVKKRKKSRRPTAAKQYA